MLHVHLSLVTLCTSCRNSQVLEVGCGASEHSLRVDAELAVAAHRKAAADHVATLIRIDPGMSDVPKGAGFGLELKAKDGLVGIRNCMTPPASINAK